MAKSFVGGEANEMNGKRRAPRVGVISASSGWVTNKRKKSSFDHQNIASVWVWSLNYQNRSCLTIQWFWSVVSLMCTPHCCGAHVSEPSHLSLSSVLSPSHLPSWTCCRPSCQSGYGPLLPSLAMPASPATPAACYDIRQSTCRAPLVSLPSTLASHHAWCRNGHRPPTPATRCTVLLPASEGPRACAPSACRDRRSCAPVACQTRCQSAHETCCPLRAEPGV